MEESINIPPCFRCGGICDGTYGYGPEEYCSKKCYDEEMWEKALDKMTPIERELFEFTHSLKKDGGE